MASRSKKSSAREYTHGEKENVESDAGAQSNPSKSKAQVVCEGSWLEADASDSRS